MSLTDKIAVVALLLNALALFYNATQVRLARNIARGQFLLQLDQMFLQHGFRVFSIVQNPVIFQEKLVNR